MFKIMVGYLLATLFGIGAFITLGYEKLLNNPQVDFIYWGLILSGGILQIAELKPCKSICNVLTHHHVTTKWMRCCHS
jgi:hypothetical protein